MRSVESSEFGEPSCWTGVRIWDVVEVRQVEYLSDSMLARDQPCSNGTTISTRNPGTGNHKKGAPPKRLFEFDEESIILPKEGGVYFEDPNFECALKNQEKTAASRRSGRSCFAPPIFQSSPL